MKPYLLLLGPFCVFLTTLATNLGDSKQEIHKDNPIHTLSRRQTGFVGTFPALGGEDKAGKVFTTTASIFTQSENFEPTTKRPALKFEENNGGERLNVNPAKTQSNVVVGRKNKSLSLTKSLLDFNDDVQHPAQKAPQVLKLAEEDAPSSSKDSKPAEGSDGGEGEDRSTSAEPPTRKRFRRSVDRLDAIVKRDTGDEAEGKILAGADLGGLSGTISVQEARANLSSQVSRSS